MPTAPGRKPDRRVAATRAAIKDNLLRLLGEMPYREINVTRLAKAAGITRATFYLHYEELDAALDEIVAEAIRFARARPDGGEEPDGLTQLLESVEAEAENPPPAENPPDATDLAAIAPIAPPQTESRPPAPPLGPAALLPLCRHLAHDARYATLLKDPALAAYLADKLFLVENTRLAPLLMRRCGLAESEAAALFRLLFAGLFAVGQATGWRDDRETQAAVTRFLRGGLAAAKEPR